MQSLPLTGPIAPGAKDLTCKLVSVVIPTHDRPQILASALDKPKLMYVISEDWLFCSHFLERALAARDAG